MPEPYLALKFRQKHQPGHGSADYKPSPIILQQLHGRYQGHILQQQSLFPGETDKKIEKVLFVKNAEGNQQRMKGVNTGIACVTGSTSQN